MSTDLEHLLKPSSVAPSLAHLDFAESHNSDDATLAASEYLSDSESPLSLKPLAVYSTSYGDLSLLTPSKKSTPFHLYNRGGTSRIIALGGLVVSLLFSISSIAVGVFIAIFKKHGFLKIVQHNAVETELLSLALNLIVTACTESIGFVHAQSLQYALASESRLHFNTNLRLVTAVRRKRWISPNGVLFNTIMAILLIMSYVSSSRVFVSVSQSTWILSPAAIILGVTLLLQVMIAYAGVRRNAKIITWSSSAFNATAALLHNDQLAPVSGRCMRNVLESQLVLGPKTPTKRQPSAWKAHPSIKPTIILLWSIFPACAIWGGIVLGIGNKFQLFQDSEGSWSLLPNPRTHTAYLPLILSDTWDIFGWLMSLSTMIVIQGALTMGLHCSEIIANVVRDETAWRQATSKKGVRLNNNPLAAVFGSWQNVALLIAKPVLHWMFGLSLNFITEVYDGDDGGYICLLFMRPVQIFYLAMALIIFAFACTYVVTRRPHGPQPAAYGHFQTLANLVDEWSPTMWWGHKYEGTETSHAGTSDHLLPSVKMNVLYA